MATKYGLALTANSVQTILPAMTQDGRVYGFYPIASTTFTGAETDFALADATVPVMSVTVDNSDPTSYQVTQYMAAVWPVGLADNYKPWMGSASFINGADGAYRWWSLPTQSWFLHFGRGALLTGLNFGLGQTLTATTPPAAPTVSTPQSVQWAASMAYTELLGDLTFFDFNWITLFNASSTGVDPTRIVVMTNPGGGTLKATVVGIPTATINGPIYDTVRIIKVADTAPGVYTFTFRIYDTRGQYTNAVLTLTII